MTAMTLDEAKARLQRRERRSVRARRANRSDASCMGCGGRGSDVIVIMSGCIETRFCETCLCDVIEQVSHA